MSGGSVAAVDDGMTVTGYAYPWDVLDAPGFTDRVRDLDLDEVAVALSYHTTRAATPWSVGRTAVLARYSALYRPVRGDVWRDAPLTPGVADWAGRTDAGGDAVRALRTAGVPTAGWIVLTHNSRLGERCPDDAVRNCFGEPYPWALCPASPRVRAYAATLTAESVAGLDLASVILEACGQLGAVHQCHHEKTDAVWSPAAARLLSVCCCAACAARWSAAGADPGELRRQLRDEVRRLLAAGIGEVDDELPEPVRALLLDTRHAATDELRAAVLAALPAGMRLVLHASVDPWATGALPGLTPSAAGDVDAVVLPCWQAGPATLDSVATARASLPGRVAVGAYVTAVAATALTDPAGYVTDLAAAGAAELHLYHVGLAGPARWSDMRSAVRAARVPRGSADIASALP